MMCSAGQDNQQLSSYDMFCRSDREYFSSYEVLLQVRMWDIRTYNCLRLFDEHVTQKPKPARPESAGSRSLTDFSVK